MSQLGSIVEATVAALNRTDRGTDGDIQGMMLIDHTVNLMDAQEWDDEDVHFMLTTVKHRISSLDATLGTKDRIDEHLTLIEAMMDE